ncbi:uncharacterized protein [Amphiura filiformis]|uniref:uncharacterized protein n=1 Tax=Amphiura filiformis TaxID=82378 RepID=UPI003B20E2E1
MAAATTLEDPVVDCPSTSGLSSPFHFSLQQTPVPYETLSNTDGDQNNNLKFKGIKYTGVIQLVCAGVGVVLSLAGLFTSLCVIGRSKIACYQINGRNYEFFAMVAWPLWSSVCFYFVASIVGIACSYRKSNYWAVAYLVMSIIASVFAAGQVVWEAFGAASVHCIEDYSPIIDYVPVLPQYFFSHESDRPFDPEYYTDCTGVNLSRALHIGSAVVGFVEFIVAIAAAVYCCRFICHQMSSQKVVVQYVNTPPTVPQPPPYSP